MARCRKCVETQEQQLWAAERKSNDDKENWTPTHPHSPIIDRPALPGQVTCYQAGWQMQIKRHVLLHLRGVLSVLSSYSPLLSCLAAALKWASYEQWRKHLQVWVSSQINPRRHFVQPAFYWWRVKTKAQTNSCSHSWVCDHGLSRTSCPWSGHRAWRRKEIKQKKKKRRLLKKIAWWQHTLNTPVFWDWAAGIRMKSVIAEHLHHLVIHNTAMLMISLRPWFVWNKVLEFILSSTTFIRYTSLTGFNDRFI